MNDPDFLQLSLHPGRALGPDQQYWQLWRQGKRPDLRTFLSTLEGLKPTDIAAIIAIDQYERWRLGERIPAEEYLPLLGEGPACEEAGCDIVYGEYLLREQLGEAVEIAEYQQRFPAFAAALARQAEVHRAFSEEAPPQTVMGLVKPPPATVPEVPGYRILGELGRGGMGVVYRAVQISLNRVVALKVMRQRAQDDSAMLERMRREAVVTARLSHPGIVAVFDAGQVGPFYYFAMEYVAGDDLHRLVTRNGPLDGQACLDYLRQVAEALEHAHQAGLVHRDIKPSNLMVVPDAEGYGQIKLLDLGLARQTEPEHDAEPITLVGAFMGTPDFIAPEQAHDPRKADARSDLYSLGCTFYYAATGKPPYEGSTPLAKLIQHNTGEVPLASQARPGLPERLVVALARLMARTPEQRFRSATELLKFLEDRPTAPPPTPTLWHRFLAGEWVKGMAFSPDGTLLAFGDVGKQVRLLDLATGQTVWQKTQHSGVLSLAFSPRGEWLAWGHEDGALTIADLRDGSTVGRGVGHASHLNALAFVSPAQVVTASHDGTLRLWDVPTARQSSVWPAHAGPIWSVSAARGVIVSCGQDKTVQRWNAALRQKDSGTTLKSAATCGAISPDTARTAVGDGSGELRVFDSSWSELARVDAHEGRMTALAWSPDGTRLLTGGRDQKVKGWSATGALLFPLSGHSGWVSCVAWSQTGTLIASGGADRQIFVWRING